VNRQEVDQLYHLLRVASNAVREQGVNSKTGLTPQEEVNVFRGLCNHLLGGGDYPALIRFSQYYGERFLLESTLRAVRGTEWQFSRVVELGAGLGWLGRGVAAGLGSLPTLFVDKRSWVLIDVVANLETEAGIEVVLNQLKEGDLIVAADLLHCLDNPTEVIGHFSKWPLAALEYCSANTDHDTSYCTQIGRYGATPIMPEDFRDMFPGRKVDIVDLEPYILLLVDKEE